MDTQTNPNDSLFMEIETDKKSPDSLVQDPQHGQPGSSDKEIPVVFQTFLKALLTYVQQNQPAQKEVEEQKPTALTEATISAKTIPQVRLVDFEHFKNRFSDEDGCYAVEALLSGPSLRHEIRVEGWKREGIRQQIQQELLPHPTTLTAPEDRPIQRVRIQSRAILHYLSKVTAGALESNDFQPRSFLYPFRPLIHFHEDIRGIMNVLARKWAPARNHSKDPENKNAEATDTPSEPRRAGVGKTSVPQDWHEQPPAESDSLDPLYDSLDVYEELRAYVDFVERRIKPAVDKYAGTSIQSITFDELWLLFSPGEYLFMKPGQKPVLRRQKLSDGSLMPVVTKVNPYQELWRLYGVTSPEDQIDFEGTKSKSKEFETQTFEYEDDIEDPDCFHLHCYYVDFDGNCYRSVTKRLSIRRFHGARSILTLPCYPLRYFQEAKQLKENLIKRGNTFTALVEQQHLSYSAWPLANNPDGESLKAEHESPHPVPQERLYIDGPVMVDFQNTFSMHPNKKPNFSEPTFYEAVWEAEADNFPIMNWSDHARTKLISEVSDFVQVRDGTAMLQRREAIKRDKCLAFLKGSHVDDEPEEIKSYSLPEEALSLLPKRAFAYALRERKYFAADISRLRIISSQEGVFDELEIPKTYKKLIRGLVSEHFEKKSLERRMRASGAEAFTQDLIGGKGKGLVILLHGAPGVGKTATAEAIASEFCKPLFIITSGDIGTDSQMTHMQLKWFFYLANRWNCILLLDEADVFLTQRSSYDLERSSLVSVFLRALDYYDGILFLTTNRVGQLDEAFKSRIHLTLHYRELNQTQTIKIFRSNIKRLRDNDDARRSLKDMPQLVINEGDILDFAKRNLQYGGKGAAQEQLATWNGRQIKNAFQLASSLAYRAMAERMAERSATGATSPMPEFVLDHTHFKVVMDATQRFNEYLKETKGFSASDLAFLAGDRADFWRDLGSHNSRPEQQQQSRSEAGFSAHPGSRMPPNIQGSRTHPSPGLYSPSPPNIRSETPSYHDSYRTRGPETYNPPSNQPHRLIRRDQGPANWDTDYRQTRHRQDAEFGEQGSPLSTRSEGSSHIDTRYEEQRRDLLTSGAAETTTLRQNKGYYDEYDEENEDDDEDEIPF